VRTDELKILIIAGWYPSAEHPIAGIFVQEQAKAAALYNQVVVLCRERSKHHLGKAYQLEEKVEAGLPTWRLSYRESPLFKGHLSYLSGLFAAFRKLLERGFRPDVIHAHVYSAGAGAVLLGKRYGIPVVISEHYSGFPRGLVRGLRRLEAKFALEWAALVLPVSENLKKHLEEYGIRARFQVVPNVVDTGLFAPRSAEQRDTKQSDHKRLLLVAGLTPIKGVTYLLEALAVLRDKRDDFRLDIVGDGPNRSEYEQLARRLGLAGIVRFQGLKRKPEVAEFMQQADFFVLPSLWENLPTVLIEALASGLPIVASRVGGIPEIVDETRGILVQPGDAEALAQALGEMLDHYRDYRPAELARYAEERFSYQTVGKLLDGIYRGVLGG